MSDIRPGEVFMVTAGMYCRECGYDLRGQAGGTEQRCPECGRQFDAGNRWTFRRLPVREAWRRWVKRVGAGLLVVGAVVGGSWGWLYWGWESEQRAVAESGAVAEVRRHLGGWVSDRVTTIYLPESATDGDLVPIKGLRELYSVTLSGSQVTDAGLIHVKELKRLKYLDLSRTRVTDAGLAHLRGLEELRILYLSGTEISDAGLVQINGLKRLRELWLDNTRISDAGLGHLKGLKGLRFLHLNGTRVSDAGMVQIEELKGLNELWLSGTKVTPAGVQELQAALPALDIIGP